MGDHGWTAALCAATGAAAAAAAVVFASSAPTSWTGGAQRTAEGGALRRAVDLRGEAVAAAALHARLQRQLRAELPVSRRRQSPPPKLEQTEPAMRTPVKRAPPAPRSPPASPLEEPGRSPTAERPLVCVIDGAIGAGKTTLIELLCEALVERGHKAVVVREPVEEWARCGILQEFYDHASSLEPGLVAYDFQTYTFVTRVEEVIKTKGANPDATIFLLERSVLTDRFVFMELQRELVGPRRMEMYDKWWHMWRRLMPFQPDKMVYLKPSLDKCMQRVNSRGREGEVVQEEEEEQGQEQAQEEEEDEEEEADSDDFLTAEEEENPGSRALDSIAEIPEPSSSAASEDDDGPDTGGGGVSSEYQERLCRAHDCYLLGQHADEFPQMPPRPFSSKDDVVVVDGALADDDFSVPGKARDRTIGHIVSSLLGQYA